MTLRKKSKGGTFTRRSFLGTTLAGAALLALNPTDHLEPKSKEAEQLWEFLRDPLPQNDSALNVIRGAVPISNVTFHHEVQPWVMQKIDQEIKVQAAKGVIPVRDYTAEIVSRYYTFPSSLESTRQCMDHVKNCYEYMLNRLDGLTDVNPTWVARAQNETSYNHKAYFGDLAYQVYSAKITAHDTEFLLHTADGIDGGTCIRKQDDWTVFLAVNENALFTTFSEFIPISTYDVAKKLGLEYGEEVATMTEETISEGLAQGLGEEMVRKYAIPNGLQILAGRYNSFESERSGRKPYRNVEKCINWIEKNSAQKALDLYMSSPERFMKAIGADLDR